MTDFSGSYDFSVQIPLASINAIIPTIFYGNQSPIQTVYPRGAGGLPNSDLYLNTPSLAFQTDGSVVISLPFTVHTAITEPNVHGTFQIPSTLALVPSTPPATGNSVVLQLTQNITVVDFDGPEGGEFLYTAVLQGALANVSGFPVIQNLTTELGFLAQPVELQIFLSADRLLHTNPTNPPADLVNDPNNLGASNDFLVYIDNDFIQQQTADQVQAMYGAYPIYLQAGFPPIKSITKTLNQAQTITLDVTIGMYVGQVPLPDAHLTQDMELSIDANDPQAGITLIPLGDPSISAGYEDVLEIFAPLVGSALVELLQQSVNKSLTDAFQSSPIGGQFLSDTLFGFTASVQTVWNTADRVALEGVIQIPPSTQEELEFPGQNWAIPKFFNNTKTWVYHYLPCFWGNQMSGDFTVCEADSQSLLAFATAPQPWDACYLCLPQLHILRPGQVNVYFKIPSQIGSGPISGELHLVGLREQEDQAGEQGVATFNQIFQVENLTPDAYGNVITQYTVQGLSQGNWTFQASSINDPAWNVEVKGSITAWTPWPIYLTYSSQDTNPSQVPPYDPAVPSGIPGQ